MKVKPEMLRRIQAMQAKMAETQRQLESEQVEASVGGGAVKAVFSGSQKMLAITISAEVTDDVEMLQDLVVSVVNEGLQRAQQIAAERLGSVTAGLPLPPGLI